jgi:hypothetical protein
MALSNLIWWPWFGVGTAAPVAPDYFPVGKPTPGRLDGPPVRRGRRRELESIFDEDEEIIAVLMDEL